jgi:hypothetical protein
MDGAAAFFENYANDKVLRDNFTLIKNMPEALPRYDDVMIWNRKKGQGYGHVSVFIHGDAIDFTSFDQNWSTISKCADTRHDYVNVVGWLHPKNQKEVNGA